MPLSRETKREFKSRKRTWLRLVLLAVLLATLVWIGWEFRPWMSEGHAVHLSDARFGDYAFQIWQRKNGSVTEPFATALFVRKTGGPWKAYMLDHQDTYRPSINLRREGSGVTVLYGKTRRAYFDEQSDIFTLYHWDGGSDVMEGLVINSDPPDDWWNATR